MRDAPLAAVLSDVASEAADRASSPEAAPAIGRTLTDWFAVTVGGSAAPATAPLLAALGAGSGDVPLAGGRGLFASVETAALIHGTAAHALELDDIYAPGLYHPGAPTIAAAMAVAHRSDVTGAQFLRGVVAGIEVGCRVAADLGPAHYRHWHTTGTAGAVGAAVAAAVTRGATREQVAQAIAVAGTMAGGVQQTFRQDGGAKPLHAGHAAQSGVVAAVTAIAGLTGAPDVLEGESGLGVATGADTQWAACRAPLGDALLVQELTVKPYPCCGHTFAAIDAGLLLRQRGVRAEDISSVRIETYSAAVETAGILQPRKSSEARFSLPHAVSVALVEGEVTRSSFDEERITDPRVRDLVLQSTVQAAADFDRDFPHRRGARVSVTLTTGDVLTAEVRDRLGSPQNPIDDAALQRKFEDLTVPVLGVEQARQLLLATSSIESLASMRDLPWTAPVGR
ncbi:MULTISPECIES: MmgE/PrpD family protein [Microbacterium]|uniref:MmgE/PrpD family protein n=1 Tax=Microbacterium wangchenii TaxID=2541726 RepID=A0ABX5T018_9MICO|nr:MULTISPECIES: MmgE/PrpD family protein [Microbacterium]MCK6066134.1 MmgE/PrpD family protein [Microbacterium sp. EYE_512]QBR90414.1 MmgE/PrpD family protein [Microbacterium wangchenii]TFV84779.1 MmgE/PrpD family protein [Microbacterium sp. dk485]TXK14439.1 MmgE/PrpD family protein [Microbacterium wangchenii]